MLHVIKSFMRFTGRGTTKNKQKLLHVLHQILFAASSHKHLKPSHLQDAGLSSWKGHLFFLLFFFFLITISQNLELLKFKYSEVPQTEFSKKKKV